jgi:hypothetical protein
LQYSITFAKILDETFGSGMGASTPVSAEESEGRARFVVSLGFERAR